LEKIENEGGKTKVMERKKEKKKCISPSLSLSFFQKKRVVPMIRILSETDPLLQEHANGQTRK
jgi:hypothetical protein